MVLVILQMVLLKLLLILKQRILLLLRLIKQEENQQKWMAKIKVMKMMINDGEAVKEDKQGSWMRIRIIPMEIHKVGG